MPLLRVAGERSYFFPVASASGKSGISGSRGEVNLYDAVAHGYPVAVGVAFRHAGGTAARVTDGVSGFGNFQNVPHRTAFVEIFRGLAGSVGSKVGDGVSVDPQTADDFHGSARQRNSARIVHENGNAGSRGALDALRFGRVGGISGLASPGAPSAVLGISPGRVGISAGNEFGIRTAYDPFSGRQLSRTVFRFLVRNRAARRLRGGGGSPGTSGGRRISGVSRRSGRRARYGRKERRVVVSHGQPLFVGTEFGIDIRNRTEHFLVFGVFALRQSGERDEYAVGLFYGDFFVHGGKLLKNRFQSFVHRPCFYGGHARRGRKGCRRGLRGYEKQTEGNCRRNGRTHAVFHVFLSEKA